MSSQKNKTPQQNQPSTKSISSTKSTSFKRPIKSVVPSLKHSKILGDFKILRRIAQEDLLTCLTEVVKADAVSLVLDPSIIGPLALIIPFSKLQAEGKVAVTHILSDTPFPTELETIVYFCRPRINLMKQMAKQIKSFKEKKKIYLFLIPRRTLICEIILQKEGVYGDIEKPIGEYALDLIPFDNQLLSMEIPYAFREYHMEGDFSSLYYVARAIMKIQTLYGVIPIIKYVGNAAQIVTKMIKDLKTRLDQAHVVFPSPEIESIILIDRSIDMVSPLVTQLTYEGLVDELYSIQNNLINLDQILPQRTKPQQTQQDPKKENQPKPKARKMVLNDDDEVFYEIRHSNFLAVAKILQRIAKEIDIKYKERKSLQSVEQIKQFMSALPGLQQKHEDLGTHIAIAQQIKQKTLENSFRKTIETEQNIILQIENQANLNFIEECIIKQEPLAKVLRLICLMSVVKNGLSQSEYDFLKKELIHSYGHEIILTLNNLEYCGLLKRNISKSTWNYMRDNLKLMEEDVNEDEPNSIAYVHSGYAPLSVRLIEKAQRESGWKGLEGILQIPINSIKQKDAPMPDTGKKVTLVFYIGGCTFAEISAIRFLEKESERQAQELLKEKRKKDSRAELSSIEDPTRHYIIATTKLINGNSLLSSLFETIE